MATSIASGPISSPTLPTTNAFVPKDLRLAVGRQKRSYHVADILAEFEVYEQSLALLHPVAMSRAEDYPAAKPLPPAGQSPYHSDTGQVVYDKDRKTFVVAAPTVAGIYGFIDNRKITAGSVGVELAPGARGFASILLTALDRQPLADSRRVLLSIPGASLATQPGSDPPRPQRLIPYRSMKGNWTLEPEPAYPDKPSGDLNSGIAPQWLERVESFLTFRTSGHRLMVYPLDGTGEHQAPLPDQAIERRPDGFRIHLHAPDQTCSTWYEMVLEPR